MTNIADNAPAPEARPEFDQLVFSLRDLVRRQAQNDTIQKAEAARRNAMLVMQRASEMFSKGEITGAELTRLHAVRLHLDALVPLPGDLPPALDRSEPRPIEGEGE